MALTPNQRAGISITPGNGLRPDTPVVLQNTFSGLEGYSVQETKVNTSVEDVVFKNMTGKTEYKQYKFPLKDYPKYNFTLIENDLSVSSNPIYYGGLTPQIVYKLPLPDPIVDVLSVQYKQDYSYLNAILSSETLQGRLLSLAASIPGISTVVAGVAAALSVPLITGGVALNQFNTVTLDSPYFRDFELNWKFVPRNYTEAKTIQSIITSLKKGMSPRFVEDPAFGFSVPGFFRYPKVYTMFFQPNSQFLYKFKPAVLRGLTVHYDGGADVPSFYKPQQDAQRNKIISESPVESVIINTNWTEIELWSKDSYKDDPNLEGMPSTDPLDAISGIRGVLSGAESGSNQGDAASRWEDFFP